LLTQAENELLTRVGPGTRMGSLLRRYWQPVSTVEEMRDRWTKRVRILGEDLVLYKDRRGQYGLIGEFCPHRRASLAYGIPTEDGLRCPYHGWKFDGTGHCVEQPNEPAGSTFKDKIEHAGYPVQELAGMLFAYFGPAPAPLLPRYDGYVAARTIRTIAVAEIPCNWLQIMENSVDPVHTEWLHGVLYEFLMEKDGVKVAASKHHAKVAFDEFEYGLVKRRLMEGQSEDSDDWRVGHPVVFPNILAVGSGGGLWHQYTLQTRVPIDDTHTLHFWYYAYVPPADAEVPQHLFDRVPVYEPTITDEHGNYVLEYFHGQDIMAWVTQGPIADRTTEALGSSDRGITLFRKMLRRELERSERGEDPMGVIRDPDENSRLKLAIEKNKDILSDGFENHFNRQIIAFSPIADDILDVMVRYRQSRHDSAAAGSSVLTSVS
jgi:5,5'-dehydrodivanillate O-demethylase